MFESENDFKKIVSRLNIDNKPNPAHRESLRRQMLSVFNKSGEQTIIQSRSLWRMIMKSPITKLAAAAVIIIAVLIGIHQFGGSIETVALADVVENMKKMPWMHATVKRHRNGKEYIYQHWCHFPSEKAFGKGQDGSVWCFDYGTGQKQFFYQPSTNTLKVDKLPEGGLYGTDSAYNLINAAVQYQAEENATISEYLDKLNGRKVKVFQIEKIMPDYGMSIVPTVVAKMKYYLLADIKTKLMIAFRAEYLNKDDRVISHIKAEVTYPETGPKDIYALGVPQTAKIIDTREVSVAKDVNESNQYATDTAAPEMVPLTIKLPRPMFVGTPQDVNKVEYLEKPLGKPRPPFYAPIGTQNAAFGKPVTSTDEFPVIGKLEWITDGDKEGSDGSFVELGPFEQHVTIDLEAEYNIYAIVVWHYHKEAHVYFDVVVQAADDPDFTANVTTVFNNDIDNSLGLGVGKDMHYTETAEGKLIDAKGARARYVRLHSDGSTSNDLNHYIEVEVYGKPAK